MTLPVQLAYRDQKEMDSATLAALSSMLGPLTGLDLSKQPPPMHQKRCDRAKQWCRLPFAC